jgi:threonine dehydrogenase-like Zn-dependent dehydrogenase
VIATGSDPVVPPIEGLRTGEYLTNETVFSLTELPARLVVIGSGPLGCELAQAFRRLGSEVDLVSHPRTRCRRRRAVAPRHTPACPATTSRTSGRVAQSSSCSAWSAGKRANPRRRTTS